MSAAGIAEVAALRTKVRRFDSADHDRMHQDTLCLDKTAVERRGCGSDTGAPVTILFYARESFADMVTGTADEICSSASCEGAKVLMQNTLFSIALAAEGEVLLMQNKVVGGSSVIEAMEVAALIIHGGIETVFYPVFPANESAVA